LPTCCRRHVSSADRSFETYIRERELLTRRIDNPEEIEQRYGHLLVDQWHFRHLPVSFVKQFADYGFALRNLEVWEHNFHEGAVFLNAFLALENQGLQDERASQIDRHLGVWSMLAGLTERLVQERHEIGVIREVAASVQRLADHYAAVMEQLPSLAAAVDAVREEQRSQAAGIKQISEEQARTAPALASMSDQVQQLWRAAGLARLMSWAREKRR
jgi:hypothetical protein